MLAARGQPRAATCRGPRVRASVHRQAEGDPRPVSQAFGFGPDPTAMGLDDVPADRQAKTGTADALMPMALHAEELVEDARQELGGNTNPAVLDGDLDRATHV